MLRFFTFNKSLTVFFDRVLYSDFTVTLDYYRYKRHLPQIFYNEFNDRANQYFKFFYYLIPTIYNISNCDQRYLFLQYMHVLTHFSYLIVLHLPYVWRSHDAKPPQFRITNLIIGITNKNVLIGNYFKCNKKLLRFIISIYYFTFSFLFIHLSFWILNSPYKQFV